MIVLGIETSCDDTGVAVLDGTKPAGSRVLSHLVSSQIKDHQKFGGVVPEIAARRHLDLIDPLIAAAMKDAGVSFDDLAGVAATCGPGLIGGVMVGMMAGKAIAASHRKPFLSINHLEAHVLSARIDADVAFPYLVLLVSGGHTQLLVAHDVGDYSLIGSTRDDAVGEAFDKGAKLLGLPYPGGPHLEKLAAECRDVDAAASKYAFAVPMQGAPGCDFSFSGLKNAIRMAVDTLPSPLPRVEAAMLAASYQRVLARHLTDRSKRAMEQFRAQYQDVSNPAFVVCGGVAANKTIRGALEAIGQTHGFSFTAPSMEFCTDNGAMIAWAGIEHLRAGRIGRLDCPAYPRWPLEQLKEISA